MMSPSSSREQTLTNGPVAMQQSKPSNSRSKVLLLFIHFFLGPLGVDRMYMGKYVSGLIKLFLLILGLVLLLVVPVVGFILLILASLFTFLDFVLVLKNALTESTGNPFGARSSLVWTSERDIHLAAQLSIVLGVVWLISTSLGLGTAGNNGIVSGAVAKMKKN